MKLNSVDSIQFPNEKPQWLDKWCLNSEPETAFAPMMKMQASKMGPKMNFTHAAFMPAGFAITVDGLYRPQWFFREGKWTCQCNCGYPKPTCLHTFLLARIMDRTVHERQWTEARRQGSQLNTTRKPITGTKRPSAREMVNSAASIRSGRAKITLEVDFKLNPGSVTLRFYLDSDHNREILRMQRLNNIASRLANQNFSSFDFSQSDKDFLIWFIRRPHTKGWFSQNLQVYKISEKDFTKWEKEWQSQPDRFIERDSQKPLNRQVKAHIVFHLEDNADKTKIHCLVKIGSRLLPFHQALPNTREKKYLTVDGALVPLQLPLKWETLVECFGKKVPSMPKAAVCDHFPSLIENRLDLIEGPNVRHEKQNSLLEVSIFKKNDQVVIEAQADKRPFNINSRETAAQRLNRNKQGYSIISAKDDRQKTLATFLRGLPLQNAGPGQWEITSAPGLRQLIKAWPGISAEFAAKSDPQLDGLFSPQKAEISLNLRENNNWLECQTMWKAGNVHLQADEVREAMRRGESLIRSRSGNWLQLDINSLQSGMTELEKLGLKAEGGRSMNFAGSPISDALSDNCPIHLHRNSQRIAEDLRARSETAIPPLSQDFKAELRHYQHEGWQFLTSRLLNSVGAILADDMGLGKTVQTLALIDSLRQQHKQPVLVVAPASVIYVWQKEAARFSPTLKTAILAGTPKQREKILNGNFDMLITSYNLVRMDADRLRVKEFSLVVLDEAQHIKNPKAKVTKAVNQLNCDRRLALSGTPVENSLGDIWSIMNFINPGYLGSFDDFQLRFANGGKELGQRISPLILRRTKEKVTPELPARTEEVIYCDMAPDQYGVYEKILTDARTNKDAGHMQVLAALTKLRQACCDPRLVSKDATSTKINALKEMLEPIVSEGHSVLIFSQFTSMLSIIEDEIKDMAPQFKITGETPVAKRPQIVDDFNDEKSASVFLLSLKAAGTGLTLTKADYVFIFDPWWNPAAERQAIDRTHRIGQENPVFVYRLVARHSVEEKILDLQEEKKKLAGDVLQEDIQFVKGLKPTELAQLLK